MAITTTPTYETFGALPAATFGGSGIPNHSVAITTVGNVTLGLSAAQRFSNPVVTNDGAGTFFAAVGDDSANGQPTYGRWNFNFYIAGLTPTAGQLVTLWYDGNPASGNNYTQTIPIPGDFQNSWNLGMAFLGAGFNPNVAGEYDFALILTNASGAEEGRSAIRVNVGSSVPDGGASALFLALSLAGIAAFRRRRGQS
jgi:hypothetical protein